VATNDEANFFHRSLFFHIKPMFSVALGQKRRQYRYLMMRGSYSLVRDTLFCASENG
jgi:hypothetical protein